MGLFMIISEFTNTIYKKHVEVHTSTSCSRMGIFKNHIEPVFGKMSFHEVSKVQIFDWRNSLYIRGYKPAMINKIQVIFGQIVKLANDLELTKARREDLGFCNLRITGQPETYLNDKQMRSLMLYCKESRNVNLLPIIQLLALTGARKREVLDLKWQYVAMDQNYFYVPKAKNGKPRKVFLNKSASQVLENLAKTRQNESEFVFPNPHTGVPYNCIYHTWDIARKKTGFPDLRIHDLRHSFASALINNGVAIYDVQHLLGHESIRTTQRYAHLDERTLKKSADQAGLYFTLN